MSDLSYIRHYSNQTAKLVKIHHSSKKNQIYFSTLAQSTKKQYLCTVKFLQLIQEMENRRNESRNEPEIVYSRAVKAGKRIYYLDVKKARNEDLYLCITESKRKSSMEDEVPQFEKHKLFLYKEDFAHFTEGLNDVIGYVQNQLGTIAEREEWTKQDAPVDDEINNDADTDNDQEPEKTHRSFFDRFKKD